MEEGVYEEGREEELELPEKLPALVSRDQRMMVPSSPADARVVPLGSKRTTLTACVCLESVARYVGCVGSAMSTRQMRTLLSPPAVARREEAGVVPGGRAGWKCAEYIGWLSWCQ